MKKTLSLLLIVCSTIIVNAQQSNVDSLKNALALAKDDYTRFHYRTELFYYYYTRAPDSAAPYAEQNLYVARQVNSDSLLFRAFSQYQVLSQYTGNFAKSLHYGFEAIKAAERTKDLSLIIEANVGLSESYVDQGDYERGILYANKAKSIYDSRFTSPFLTLTKTEKADYANTLHKLALAYEKSDELDSALKYIQYAEQLTTEYLGGNMTWPAIPIVYGNIYFKKADYQKAIRYYHWGFYLATNGNVKKDVMSNGYGLAITYNKINQVDSSIFYANKVFEAHRDAKFPIVQLDALTLLADVYKAKNKNDSAAKYFELALTLRDSLFKRDNLMQMQTQTFDEQVRQQEIQEEAQKRLYSYRLYALLAGLTMLAIIAFLLYRNMRRKQKAKVKIEEAYKELKNTQAQLIQSEKMASLGELTAGIAHEIQNPLNFVNNFSEVNKELLVEMKEEIKKGNIDDANSIANDIIENQEKINLHGKRADAIVKNMLQHSRSSSGKKEPTEINTLADEYLRLAYHGLRAKDKTFSATMKTDFDDSIGRINIIRQDIGRVVLNLINNAFYAVDERMKQHPENYEPAVSISTRKMAAKILISVKDNGNGISKKVLDKIFQPFFTTKPTGQGTGLGLSLSYDIVKAHGGEIKVNTREGEFTEFIVQLPISV